MSLIIVLAVLAIAGYYGYKYVKSRNSVLDVNADGVVDSADTTAVTDAVTTAVSDVKDAAVATEQKVEEVVKKAKRTRTKKTDA